MALLLLLLLLVVLTLRTEGGCVNNPTHCLFQASFFGVGGNSPPPKNRLQSPPQAAAKMCAIRWGKLTRSHRPPSRSGKKGEGATAKRREEKAGGLLRRGQEGGKGDRGTESEGKETPPT